MYRISNDKYTNEWLVLLISSILYLLFEQNKVKNAWIPKCNALFSFLSVEIAKIKPREIKYQ